MQETLKGSAKIVVLLFLVLLAGSVFYYRERMLFVDPGWVVFNNLNHHDFLFAEYRYGAFITQMFPVILGYLQAPLKIILIVYSASFYIFYLVVVLLLLYRFRQYALAILMAFYFTLFVSDVYFWPNNEVHQGIAWMFLFLGLIFQQGSKGLKWFHHLLLLALAFLAIFSHFIVIIPFSFLWLFLWMDQSNRRLSPKIFVGYSLLLIMLFLVKFRLGVDGWYDGEKLKGVTRMSWATLLGSFTNGHAKSIIPLFFKNYWLVGLIAGCGVFALWRQKKYLLVAMTLAYGIGYFALLCMTYPDAFGRGVLFYMESEWMALAIVAAVPFVYKVLPVVKMTHINLVLSAIFCIRIGYIAYATPAFSERTALITDMVQLMRQKKKSKLAIIPDPKMEQKLLMHWGTPVESLLQSVIDGGGPQVTFKIVGKDERVTAAADSFMSCFSVIANRELNPFYFHVDSTENYEVLTYEELLRDTSAKR